MARIRWVYEQLPACEVMVCADARDIHVLLKVGDAWTPQGTAVEVMTPGRNKKHDLAGALDLSTGTLCHCRGPRNTNGLFRELLQLLDTAYPSPPFQRVSVVVDNDKIHQAKAVAPWVVQHPRLTRLLLPTYGPRANPIERAVGDVHDLCTWNHPRQRLRDLVADVEAPLHVNGPWHDKLSELHDEPAVTTAVANLAAEEQANVVA